MPVELTLEVRGGCMSPLLRPGDGVRVRDASLDELALGDLVVFLTDGAPADGALSVHRLVWRSRRGVRTKGDALWRLDPPTPASGVLGKVVAIRRAGGPWLDLTGSRALWHRAAALASIPYSLLRPLVLTLLAAAARLLVGREERRAWRLALARAAVSWEAL